MDRREMLKEINLTSVEKKDQMLSILNIEKKYIIRNDRKNKGIIIIHIL